MPRTESADGPFLDIARDLSATLIEAAGGLTQHRISEPDRRIYTDTLDELIAYAATLLDNNEQLGTDAAGRTWEQLTHQMLDQDPGRLAPVLSLALVRLAQAR